MNPILRLLFSTLITLLCFSNLVGQTREELWQKVEEADSKRLPQTALTHLDPIIKSALADEADAEALRAIAKKVSLETEIQGLNTEERIALLKGALETTPPRIHPILHTLTAYAYWSYFQQNRWRFHKRTQVIDTENSDFKTWDLPRILKEIDQHFAAALADSELLQRTPIEDYDSLLEKGTAPDRYRPTLYDFLVHEALQFYQLGEQGAIAAESPPSLTKDSPLFAPAFDFATWQISLNASDSPEYKAIRLYQDLLLFHQNDADQTAYRDADLARISYARNIATGENRDRGYRIALETFIEAASQHEISSLARAYLAQHHYQIGDAVTAYQIAKTGAAAFPESLGAASCHNLIQEIEAKTLQLSTEAVWNDPFPTIDVTYRNIGKIYFRAYSGDARKHLTEGGDSMHEIDLDPLEDTEPVAVWQAELTATDDFQERKQSVASVASLKPGFYHIVASANPDFSEKDNQLSSTNIWVSNLALVVRTEYGSEVSKQIGGFVLDAKTGRPVEGAEVQIWNQKRNDTFRPGQKTSTNSEGRFFLKRAHQSNSHFVHATYQGHAIASQPEYFYGGYTHHQPIEKTVFFTDRALYRPGQTIHYKGICIETDKGEGHYATLQNQDISVALFDPNGQQVALAKHQTNDYGSFSGSFTAPDGGLTGAHSIRTVNTPHGAASISVEEYKRPKFQTELLSPEVAPKLGETTAVKGRASAYTGAAVDGAKVVWRVERTARPASWCWWWQPQQSQAIAHGETETSTDGTFAIEFEAAPDPTISAELEPVFSYRVYADVTDNSGETRSASLTTLAGYTALQASIHHEGWQTTEKPVKLSIETTTLDDAPLTAKGVVRVFTLQQPDSVQRPALAQPSRWWHTHEAEPPFDASNPSTWEKGQRIGQKRFSTDSDGAAELSFKLPAGPYRIELATKDRFGKSVTAVSTLTVVDPEASSFATKIPQYLNVESVSIEPGDTFNALWGTGYPKGQAYVEILQQGQTLQSYWTPANQSQALITFPITEAHRGGITIRTTFVQENRLYAETKRINVPWTNKQLDIKWERFRSKLEPGQEETWTAILSGPNAELAAAEMVATLYDASLDQYRTHNWIPNFIGEFSGESRYATPTFTNHLEQLEWFGGRWKTEYRHFEWEYRSFPSWFAPSPYISRRKVLFGDGSDWGYEEVFELTPFEVAADEGYAAPQSLLNYSLYTEVSPPAPPPPPIDLSQVTARSNLNETAFFYPHLLSDEDGTVKIQFTMPEALTKWRFLGFAHDQDIRSGFLSDTAVTAKDLMVQPNPPRFLREGDEVEFSVKVSNQSDSNQKGKVRLTFADAATLSPADESLSNFETEQTFTIPAKESRNFTWRIKVPDGARVLTYKAVGATNSLSDGEEGFLPVLSRRILVTESIPLPIRGPGEERFRFEKLLASQESDTLRHQNLTLQMVSQPAWYAVMALPYLMEFPHECSEQLFSRFYANTLGSHIANSDPKIRRVFDLWKNTEALDSPLEKNQELKSILIEETPWLRQSQNEGEARRRVGNLFDENRLKDQSSRALKKLSERQLPDGRWSWFPGGRANDYITLYITAGFARLRNLGAHTDVSPALRSLGSLDRWMSDRYEKIIEDYKQPESYVPSHYDAFYLYARSFYLQDRPISKKDSAAIDFFQERARENWQSVSSRQTEAHLAIALQRFGDTSTPMEIISSLKERSVSDRELGMHWRDSENRSWWWHHAPIETQALMIEAFAEVAQDERSVEDMQVWLLKQKQTQSWKTTKATTDAIYALLLRGQNLLASDEFVSVTLGDQRIEPTDVEAGTGFYQKTFIREEIKPEMGRVVLDKPDDGVSWGSLHWQYLEDISAITPHHDTPFSLRKALFVKENSPAGPVLKPITSPLSMGDELVVRIELRADRDMEFIHLKDQRGSGTEPVNVLSGYRYQDGLGYYESTRDTASHFFISHLPKGTYVFEYSTRVQLKGRYQSGIAQVQSMYAPEFNSHSESVEIVVE